MGEETVVHAAAVIRRWVIAWSASVIVGGVAYWPLSWSRLPEPWQFIGLCAVEWPVYAYVRSRFPIEVRT